MKKATAIMIVLFLASVATVAIAHADETHDITGPVNATVTRTDGYDAITFSIQILSLGPHYGVGIAFATSTVQPAFQVWYKEYATPYGWYYQDWTGTGWHGWGGPEIPLGSKAGFSATGDHTGQTFTITVPTTALGGWGATYYYGIQVRTTLINHYPSNFGWTSHESPGIAASYHSATVPVPPPIEVQIDIKPGSYPNSINLGSKGVVPVAVLTTSEFDASTVNPETVVFAGAHPVRWVMQDVDYDGDMDMLFFFKAQDLGLVAGSTEANLTGATLIGWPIQGTDTVNIVPK